MCDFKPGDEVVCVFSGPWKTSDPWWREIFNRKPVKGRTYTVTDVGVNPAYYGGARCMVAGLNTWYAVIVFRKVQRRDLSAWLKASIGNTDKLDKRQTKKVGA